MTDFYLKFYVNDLTFLNKKVEIAFFNWAN